MAEEKKSFVLYADYIHTVRKLPKDKAGELFLTILAYVNDENPMVNDMLVDVVFEPIKQQLKRDLIKYELKRKRAAENGRAGGLKSGEVRNQNEAIAKNTAPIEANEANASSNQANEAVNDNDTVTVNDNVIIREGNGGTIPTAPPENSKGENKKERRSRMAAPKLPANVKEVEKFMYEKMKNRWDPGFVNLQAHKFFNHYEANGWKQSKGNKIQSWQHAANMWIFRDIEKKGPQQPAINPAPVPASPRIVSPAPPQLTPEQIEKKTIEFTESIYQEFKLGTLKEDGLPSSIYDQLRDKGLLVLNQEEKDKILNECGKNEIKAKKRALSTYFASLIEISRETVYENV